MSLPQPRAFLTPAGSGFSTPGDPSQPNTPGGFRGGLHARKISLPVPMKSIVDDLKDKVDLGIFYTCKDRHFNEGLCSPER